MLAISENEIETLLPIDDCIDSMEKAFMDWGHSNATNMPRYRLPLTSGALQVLAGSSGTEEVAGIKTYVTGSNQGTQMVVLLYSTATGKPIAILNSTALGQIRTGAASGLATKYLTINNSKTVAVIGSGFQAETQLSAMQSVRNIDKAFVYSRNKDNRQNFANKMSKKLNIEIEPVNQPEHAIANSDIICTITNSREPVFSGESLLDGVHINAAGSNHWARRELDNQTISKCKIVVCDDVDNAKSECGELIWAAETRKFNWNQAYNLKDIVSNQVDVTRFINSTSLFESQGLGIEDVYAGMYVYRKAIETGLGKEIHI